MARRWLPRALGAALDNFVLAPGEVVFDQTSKRIRMGDGETPGGQSLLLGPASGLWADRDEVVMKDGSTMTGDLVMADGAKITGLPHEATDGGDAISKAEFDQESFGRTQAEGNLQNQISVLQSPDPVPNSKIYGGSPRLSSGASAPVTPAYGYIGPQNLVSFGMGGRRRSLTDRLADTGAVLDDFMGVGNLWDAYAALSKAVTRSCRVVAPTPGYLFRVRMLLALISGTVLAGPSACGAAGVPLFLFQDNADSMLQGDSNLARAIRLEGHHHWSYLETPTGTFYAVALANITGFHADYLALTNVNRGLSIAATASDIYIGHLHVEGTVALNVSAGCTRVRIGRITGTGSITVASGADCIIGAEVGGLLPGLSAISPAANKAIIYDSAGAPQLTDWIVNGSFTPTVTCGTPGDLSIAATTASGVFTKRGRQVEVTIALAFTPSWTTASGNIQIGGLPYVADSSTVPAPIPFSTLDAITWPTSCTMLFASVIANQNYMQIQGRRSGASDTTAQISMFPTGAARILRLHGSYRAAS